MTAAQDTAQLSVIIPACNEAAHITACLSALLGQTGLEAGALDVIVAANGCSDDTVALAEQHVAAFAQKGWSLRVLDIPEGSKIGALNTADTEAWARNRAYLDADVRVAPALLRQILAVLAQPEPVYVTGRMHVMPARSWVSRRYGALWTKLPFMRPGTAQGAGFFAVNTAGRARWGAFPDVIADDGFVRWQFSPAERVEVEAGYDWPLVEGFAALVRVRRRQDMGGTQLKRLYPGLDANEGKPGVSGAQHLKLFLGQPISYSVYVAVQLAVRRKSGSETSWDRGAR